MLIHFLVFTYYYKIKILSSKFSACIFYFKNSRAIGE